MLHSSYRNTHIRFPVCPIPQYFGYICRSAEETLWASELETERALAKSLIYADDIIATLREPFLVLDGDLLVQTCIIPNDARH